MAEQEERRILTREEINDMVEPIVNRNMSRIENLINRPRPQDQIDTRALEVAQAALTKADMTMHHLDEHMRDHGRFYEAINKSMSEFSDSLRRVHERIETRDGAAFKVAIAMLAGCLGVIGFLAAKVLWGG